MDIRRLNNVLLVVFLVLLTLDLSGGVMASGEADSNSALSERAESIDLIRIMESNANMDTASVGAISIQEPARPYASLTDSSKRHPVVEKKDSSLALWINLVTALILLLALFVSYWMYEHATRPVIKLSLGSNPEGFKLAPVISNVTNTDAVGLVELSFLINDESRTSFEEDDGAYTGKWIWNFPARGTILGNTDIGRALERIRELWEVPNANSLAIEARIYYMRWKLYRFPWLSTLFRAFRRVYSSPLYKWEMKNGESWVFVPAHDTFGEAPTVNISLVRRRLLS